MRANDFIFKHIGHKKSETGLIGCYHLEVTDTRSGKIATISVEPKHLASARSMKRILLDRCILYSATRAEHNQMLLKMFDYAHGQAENEDFALS
jgi:hypothetical protein